MLVDGCMHARQQQVMLIEFPRAQYPSRATVFIISNLHHKLIHIVILNTDYNNYSIDMHSEKCMPLGFVMLPSQKVVFHEDLVGMQCSQRLRKLSGPLTFF